MLGDPRRELGLERLHLRGRHRRAEVVEDAQHPVSVLPRPLERLDGVREGRLASGSAAIASTSARCSATPASNAGR